MAGLGNLPGIVLQGRPLLLDEKHGGQTHGSGGKGNADWSQRPNSGTFFIIAAAAAGAILRFGKGPHVVDGPVSLRIRRAVLTHLEGTGREVLIAARNVVSVASPVAAECVSKDERHVAKLRCARSNREVGAGDPPSGGINTRGARLKIVRNIVMLEVPDANARAARAQIALHSEQTTLSLVELGARCRNNALTAKGRCVVHLDATSIVACGVVNRAVREICDTGLVLLRSLECARSARVE